MPSSHAAVLASTRPGRAAGRLSDGVLGLLVRERQRWILWLPVLVGTGIAIYFGLPAEPPPWLGAQLAVAAAVLAGIAVAVAGDRREVVRPVAVGVFAVILGFAAAQTKAQAVATEMLRGPVGPSLVGGRVDRVESFPDGQRLTLDRLTLTGLNGGDTPESVRLRLRGAQPTIRPGDVIQVRAMLMPPPAPAVPGAYDFQRQAYFDGLGAVGYSIGRATVQVSGSPEGGLWMWFAKLRFTVGERVRAVVSGAAGAVTIALLNGEMRAIPEDVMAAIRDSGLAHLLSISGLHIGLVAGIVLVVVRSALALVPWVALRYPIKKWAAVVSVLAAGAYTLLAAAPVPSQRSFLMIAIVLLAVLVDRQGISIRLVVFAALAILLTQPESMLGPSFQMSFAAVTALIVAYEEVRDRRPQAERDRSIRGRVLLYLGGVMLSTVIAGIATAPFAAYHFNRFQVYGVAANMVAVPVTGFWIMPCAILSMLLMPFGLEAPTLIAMSWGVEVVIFVAHAVAAWPGAVLLLPPMPTWGLCLITLGGLWLCLWRLRWRWLGLAAIVAGLAGMLTTRPPDLLIDGSGRLLAARTADGGLIFSSRSARRATREAWLRRAGAEEASGLWPRQGASGQAPLRCDSLGCVYTAGGRSIAIAQRGEALLEDCGRADAVISLLPVRGACPRTATVIDRFDLWRAGAHAVWVDEGVIRVESVGGVRGERPWVLSPETSAEAPPGTAGSAGGRSAGGAAAGGAAAGGAAAGGAAAGGRPSEAAAAAVEAGGAGEAEGAEGESSDGDAVDSAAGRDQ